MEITLYGKPQSTNHIYKHTCRWKYPTVYMTQEGKKTKQDYALQAKMQWKKLDGDINMMIEFYFWDKRKHDIDNYNKIVLDSLSGIIYDDDEQIQQLHIYKHYDKENPRIELTIENETM